MAKLAKETAYIVWQTSSEYNFKIVNIEVFLSTVNFQISIIKIPSVFEKQ